MKRSIFLTVAFVLTACTVAQAEDGAFDPARAVATPTAAIDYQNVNEAIRMGAAYGDRAAGAHGTFGTFPPNFITPVHRHTFAYHGVVIAGTMTNPFGETGQENPPELAAGS